jgi:uncharacterized protein (DUF3084 family)
VTNNTKTVEDRIREHYQVANGEWLVEKGRVKEARLLKEAAERIDSLKPYEQRYYSELLRRDEKIDARRCELDDRENKLRARELRIERGIEQVVGVLESLKGLK